MSNNTLCKLLLNVKSIQPTIMLTLMEKLNEYILKDFEDVRFEDNIPKLILSQFRCLDFIVSNKFITNILELLAGNASTSMKKEIIEFLPEIVNDADEAEVIQTLKQLMTEHSELSAQVLESISNLNISQSTDLMEFVVQKLQSASLGELSVVIKFLFQHGTEKNSGEV